MDIANWLESLGLERYLGAFRDAEIEADVLADLSESDLESLGLPLGPRRRILKAIAALGANSPPAPPSADTAERRQLTVMFADLVGSTALSARLDPEDTRKVIRAYQDAVSGVVARYDGFVAKFMGDGVLAYFGFPRAHEDDATRAVHAGLEIAEIVAALKTPARETLAARIGVATGLVVVGDIIGDGPAREQAVVGDTPNLAARLQGLADAGGVVIAAATRRLVGETFAFREMGKHAVKGLPEPVEAFAALGVSGSESRFDAARGSRLAGFVGREAEAAELLARQRRAWEGRGQIALISGEAGIGKSRLSAWLAEQVADIPHTRLRYQCSPYHRDSALYPFARQFERAAGFEAREPPEAKLEKLEAVLGRATDRVPEIAPLIAAMLAIPTGGRYPAQNLSPAQQRRQTLFALLDQLEGLATRQPVLMLFEDAHWADATSLEALDLAIERLRKLPVLLIVTHRPEFAPSWKGLPDVAEIALQKLDRSEAENLVSRVARGRALPPDALAQIVDKTDGVPLFVEELTKTVLESGLLSEGAERSRFDGPPPPLAIPSTLRDSLMARLDRLADAKEIAQIGAAIGREFSYALLRAVVDRDEPTLLAALTRLERSELVFRSGEPPAARYAFKHALVRDAAYESLLKSRRQMLHREIAEALRAKFPEIVEAEPELLAHHFTQAGLTEPAIEYWGKAGDLALRRSAFKEAIAHLGKAIEMTEAGGGEAGKAVETDPAARRMKLQTNFGQAVMWSKGFAVEETNAALARAGELATETGDAGTALENRYGLILNSLFRGDMKSAQDLAESFLRESEDRNLRTESTYANAAVGLVSITRGDFTKARLHFEQTLRIYDPRRDREAKFRFGSDSAAASTAFLALAVWCSGDVARARELIDEALSRAVEADNIPTLVHSYNVRSVLEIVRNDAAAVRRAAEAGVGLRQEHGLRFWQAWAGVHMAWTRAKLEDRQAGAAELRDAITGLAKQGNKFHIPLYHGLLAEVEAEGRPSEPALVGIEKALSLAGETGQHWYDAELHRIRGVLLLAQFPADTAPAEAAFLKAIEIARAQKARSFELRAALALAELYRSAGREADAQAALAPALEGFSPTPEFPEIARAAGLLTALGETEAVKAATAARRRRVHLHVAYGNALMSARGHGDSETVAAFERANALAAGVDTSAERFSIYYGQWAGCYVRGELAGMRELAGAFLRECESEPNSAEASVALRVNGVTRWFAGEFTEARSFLERALALLDPERDRELVVRFGQDIGVPAMGYHALLLWARGEVELAREYAESLATRSARGGGAATSSFGFMLSALFEIQRGDFSRAAKFATALANVASEHGMSMWAGLAVAVDGWVDWHGGNRSRGLETLRRGLDIERNRGAAAFVPLFETALAEIEVEAGEIDAAVATIGRALAESDRAGQRWFDAELHRIRGAILLAQSPADPAPAEAAFLKAIEIARAQKARSFELRAALALAKLYRSNDRDADARAALGPALEGFSPTPEFPEIAEAKSLLGELAGREAFRAGVKTRREPPLLQVATDYARGAAAPETTRAFSSARERAGGIDDAPERLSVVWGQWLDGYTRGELPQMRALARDFLVEVAERPRSLEAAAAYRIAASTHLFAGEFGPARDSIDRALACFDPALGEGEPFRFGGDFAAVATPTLAFACLALGDFERARNAVEEMVDRVRAAPRANAIGSAHMNAALFEITRGDPARATPHARALASFAREGDLDDWRPIGRFFEGWLAWRDGDVGAALSPMREMAAEPNRRGGVASAFAIALAQAEAEAGEFDLALATLDRTISESVDLGRGSFLAEALRVRGAVLATTNSDAAEAAFRAAIDIARAQEARAFELRAALALAELYRSTGRDAEARDALGPALEGFSPTPEFPEIAEAKGLLDGLARAEAARSATDAREPRLDRPVAHGAGAPETKAGAGGASRPGITFGLWVKAEGRGELARMRASADAFQRDAEESRSPFLVAVAHRVNGLTKLFTGDYVGARADLERAVATPDSALESDLAIGFHGDPGVIAMGYLTHVLWALGEADRARAVAEELTRRIERVPQLVSGAFGRLALARFEMIRGDFERAALHSRALAEVDGKDEGPQSRKHLMPIEGWVAWRRGDRDGGARRMRQGVSELAERKFVGYDGLYKSRLAEAEADSGDVDPALATIDGAIAAADRTGQRNFDAVIHRARGEILARRTPEAAESAFLAAIEIARAQKTRAFELRAALSLAKLRRSTGGDADARAILASALEGFAPTPEFPEIAEAMELLAARASPGEAEPALVDDTAGQCALLSGLWAGAHLRGELAKMREFADALTRLGQARPESVAAGLAHRANGATALFAGDFVEARRHLDPALAMLESTRDDDPGAPDARDSLVGAGAELARALWPLGEVDRSRATLELALARAGEVAHLGATAHARFMATMFEWARRDFAAAEPHVHVLTRLARDHDVEPWKAFGLFLEGWLANRAGRRETALTRMRRGVETLDAKGIVAHMGPIRAALAEAEAAFGDIDAALATLDAAIAQSDRSGQRGFDSELRRLRAEIGLPRDRRAAKADVLAALTIARDQKAKSFELRAALSFAKFRRASGRDADARDAVERALDGFTPTSALPEMAEALALLGAMRAAAG